MITFDEEQYAKIPQYRIDKMQEIIEAVNEIENFLDLKVKDKQNVI